MCSSFEATVEFREIESFLKYFESVRTRTRNLAVYVPEEYLEWRSAEGRFSSGDLLRHIAAAERWMWAENARLNPSKYPGHGQELASGLDQVLSYMDSAHSETIKILRDLTPEQLQQRCETVGGTKIRVWKWLRLMVEHEIHHRGQLYELLGQLGVEVPPLYGLTEPEVKKRSS
jgi:uncharacterized damage-inducible protein DinB